MNSARKVFSLFNAKERWQAAALMVAAMATALMQVASVGSILPLLRVLTDRAVVTSDPFLTWAFTTFGFNSTNVFLIVLGAGVVALLIVTNTLMAANAWLVYRFAWDRHHAISVRLLQHYLDQPYVSYLTRDTSLMARNVLNEIRDLTDGVVLPLLRLFSTSVTVVFILGFLIWYSPFVSLAISIIFGTSYGIIFLLVRRVLRRAGRDKVEANGIRFRQVNQAFEGIKDVKLLGVEAAFLADFIPASWRYSRAGALQLVLGEVPRFGLEGVVFGTLLMVMLILAVQTGDMEQVIPLGGVFAYGSYRLLTPLRQGFQALTRLRFNEASADLVHQEMKGARATPSGPGDAVDAGRMPFQRELRLEHATFTYPGAAQPALCRVSLSIPRYASVGIVGATGAGKTTLVDVLLGLLRPQEGRVVVDGVLLGDADLRAWQNNLGYVPQHIYLYDDTVARNIAFGVAHEQIDHAAVERAARIANIHDFVTQELPQGYGTRVGDRGIRLSGGQRQRIGIARALYNDPEVLVLDEATSSLDNVTEQVVQEAIERAASAKTLIVIAHRLSTVRGCDVIYVMERGRIVASGPYDELLKTNDGFRALAGQTA